MRSNADATHRFSVRTTQGEQVAAAEHIEDAMTLLRVLPRACEVVRKEDGAVLAFNKPDPSKRGAYTSEWSAFAPKRVVA